MCAGNGMCACRSSSTPHFLCACAQLPSREINRMEGKEEEEEEKEAPEGDVKLIPVLQFCSYLK